MVDLYKEYKKYSYSELKECFYNAKSKDEQDFYIALSNFLLQKAQEELLKKENEGN